ncbi:MAG: DUF58 domain-containing protein [Pelagimonas sp.]|nr:DUF58 domain-containing protein [Pelagimonas sp.]
MTPPASLRFKAQTEASRFPALLARAEQLAGTVLLGEHGRRRSGMGDDFWQYRPLRAGDSLHDIDWRRSARSDEHFVREHELQIAQSVLLWVDPGASMRFASDKHLPEKSERARVLGLAVAILLLRGGERVGLTGIDLPPARGDIQVMRLAQHLSNDHDTDHAVPDERGFIPYAKAVFLSDFLGDLDATRDALTKAADRGISGVLMQVLDPAEERFPYKGRTIFESITGALRHETLKASDLRDRYLGRLAARKDALKELCRQTGWQHFVHHTDQPAQSALMWIYRALDGAHG